MNKPMMIQDERLEKCKAQLAEAQASVTQLGIALVQEREKSAEAQADNAALVESIMNILNTNLCNAESPKPFVGNVNPVPMMESYKLMNQPHPGAPLMAELDQLRKENANYKDIVGLSCEEYRIHREKIALLEAELVHLRKVRDAAEKAIYTKSQVGKTRYEYDFSKALCQVQLALAQAKGAE